MPTDFEQITSDYIAAIEEHKKAHAEIMESHNEETERRYSQAVTSVEKLHGRWLEAFRTPPTRSAS